MKNRIICDSHTHSNNSFDAENSVMQMLEYASRINLSSLTITDHFASELYYKSDTEFGDLQRLLLKSISDVHVARSKGVPNTELLCGIELGEPLHNLSATQEVLRLTDYDFVLCSVHNIREKEDFFLLDYETEDITELLKKYFLELCECIQWGDFDSLAHITYPFRYIGDKYKTSMDLSRYKLQIDELLSLLVENDKALEFNTCRNDKLTAKSMNTCRDVYFLKRFKELGGRFITLGSDAHRVQDIAKGIDGAVDILYELGYKEITFFKKRKPTTIAISREPNFEINL